MALCPASVTARSNSDMLTIDAISADASIDPSVRMEMILSIARGWDRATDHSTERHAARAGAERRYQRALWPYAILTA